jgi:hypothetical protein
MILFTLKCAADHEFEAWFRDNAAFDRQRSRGLITCPDCGSTEVDKALMAPRLAKSGGDKSTAPPSPQQVRQMLQQLRRHIETHCENVGERFAEEARRIHRGEADARGIYGDATADESRALADEGIEVSRIPWVPASDA